MHVLQSQWPEQLGSNLRMASTIESKFLNEINTPDTNHNGRIASGMNCIKDG